VVCKVYKYLQYVELRSVGYYKPKRLYRLVIPAGNLIYIVHCLHTHIHTLLLAISGQTFLNSEFTYKRY